MAGPGVQHRDLDFLKNLCYVSALRGIDGTGLCQGSVTKHHLDIDIYKSKYEASWAIYDMLHDEKYKKKDFLDSVVDNTFIGHCRAATVGSISDENAHPFENKHLVGVHNGTLTDGKYRGKEKTDSELLFEEIGESGLIPTLRNLERSSAYAIVILDKETHKINIIRNEKRGLWCAFNKERSVLYWASEPEMIDLCASRNNIKIGELAYFAADKIYSFHPSEVKKNDWPNWSLTPLSPPVVVNKEKIKGKTSLIIINDKKKEEVKPPFNDNKSTNWMENLVEKSKDIKGNLTFRQIDPKPSLVIHEARKVPHTTCCGCGSDLNLVTQYFAKRIIDPKTNTEELMCTDCVELTNKANFTEEEIRSIN